MTKTIYRICLIAVLIATITVGIIWYNEYTNRGAQEEWVLV